MTGPICEYCGSVLDQAEIDRQEQELAEKQRQYEELLRQLAIIEEKQKDFGYEDVFWVWVIIVILLIAVLITPFLA